MGETLSSHSLGETGEEASGARAVSEKEEVLGIDARPSRPARTRGPIANATRVRNPTSQESLLSRKYRSDLNKSARAADS